MAGVVVVNLIAGLVIAVVLLFPGPDDPPPEESFLHAVAGILLVGTPLILLLVALKWVL